MVTTTFYRGRPTRGAHLKPIGRVIWSGVRGPWPSTYSEEPFAYVGPYNIAAWSLKRWHRIDRRRK